MNESLIDRARRDDPAHATNGAVRVLHVVATGQRRGAEMFASELTGELAGHGLDQHVVVLRADGKLDIGFSAPTEAWTADGWRLPGLRVGGRAVSRLRSVVRYWHPDVIQAHGGEALKYAALAAGSTKIVYRRIGSAPPWVARGPRRRIHGAIMRRANRVVALSDTIREQTIAMYRLRPDRVITIPRGVSPSRLEPRKGRDALRAELAVPADAKVMLSLGALTREKDPLAHVELARRVFVRMPNVFHLIAGDGPLRDEVEQAIDDAGIRERARVLGNRADVADLLAASDVMLLLSATEGMPGCLIEAGMAGLPSVAYSVGAVADVIEDGVTGLLAPPGRLESLTDHVLRLLEDERLHTNMATAARELCNARFDTAVIARRYVDLYEQVAGRH